MGGWVGVGEWVGVGGCGCDVFFLPCQMKKGDSIHRFLAKVLESIRKEFTELRSVIVYILVCIVCLLLFTIELSMLTT